MIMRLRLDNPVFEYINTVVQFIALNLIFLLCCLPIVTAGSAIAALYQVTLREARGEHGYLIRKFFQHFKELFVQGALTFLLFAAVLFVTVYSMVFWFTIGSAAAWIALILTGIFFLVVVCAFLYVFPLMARFENSFWQTIKNSFLLSLSHPKFTAILFLILLFLISMLYLFSAAKIFMLIVGFSFIAYCNSMILTKLFQPYETAAVK